MDSILITKIALVGTLGVGAQWLAWRAHLPAIVLLTVAGIAAFLAKDRSNKFKGD